jgi:hypothetical protein
MTDTSKKLWKPILFVALNVFFIVWIGIILEMLLRVLGGDDPLALLGIFAADVAFAISGILLVILNKYYPVSIINRALPFIALIALTLVALLNVTAASLWFGVVMAVALILGSVVTTISTIIRAQR